MGKLVTNCKLSSSILHFGALAKQVELRGVRNRCSALIQSRRLASVIAVSVGFNSETAGAAIGFGVTPTVSIARPFATVIMLIVVCQEGLEHTDDPLDDFEFGFPAPLPQLDDVASLGASPDLFFVTLVMGIAGRLARFIPLTVSGLELPLDIVACERRLCTIFDGLVAQFVLVPQGHEPLRGFFKQVSIVFLSLNHHSVEMYS